MHQLRLQYLELWFPPVDVPDLSLHPHDDLRPVVVLHHLQGTGGVEDDLPGLGHVHSQDLDVGFCPGCRTEFELA